MPPRAHEGSTRMASVESKSMDTPDESHTVEPITIPGPGGGAIPEWRTAFSHLAKDGWVLLLRLGTSRSTSSSPTA